MTSEGVEDVVSQAAEARSALNFASLAVIKVVTWRILTLISHFVEFEVLKATITYFIAVLRALEAVRVGACLALAMPTIAKEESISAFVAGTRPL